MKVLAVLLLLLSSAAAQNPGPALTGAKSSAIVSAISYTGVECDNNVSSGTSIACTLTVPGTGTHTLVIFTSVNAGAYTNTTATCGTVHTIRSQSWNTVIASTGVALAVYNATPGSCTITTNMTVSNFPTIMVADFVGANASSPVDNASCTSTPFCTGVGIGTAMTNGTITTTNPGEMVIGMGENFSLGSAPTTVAGYTGIPGTATSAYYAMNYAPATGTYTPSFVGQGADWIAMAIALTT